MSEPPLPAEQAPATLRTLLRDGPYGFYLANRVVQTIAMSVQTATIAWQVYDITGSALPLAAVGVIRFVPAFIMSFLGGAVADTRDGAGYWDCRRSRLFSPPCSFVGRH